jgi:hypothetical protein
MNGISCRDCHHFAASDAMGGSYCERSLTSDWLERLTSKSLTGRSKCGPAARFFIARESIGLTENSGNGAIDGVRTHDLRYHKPAL